GMAGHGGAGDMPMRKAAQGPMDHGKGHGMMHGMGHGAMAMGGAPAGWVLAGRKVQHPPGGHGPGAAMVTDNPQYRMDEPGVGLASTPGHRVLVYDDLRALAPWPDRRPPQREIELHLTGNMERYMWSFDGKKFTEVTGPIHFRHGERLRLIMVNDTMMDHPIHLHGMWMELENAQGEHRPRKHTVVLKPGEMLSVLITADAPGDWAFHCHLLYHMKAGMFRVVSVS
ncbi:MAG TPA: copper resistance protein CopA, partial [Chromatiales bacterium]|nr:copper resistance protein CopA [Chromatiales bacterium]